MSRIIAEVKGLSRKIGWGKTEEDREFERKTAGKNPLEMSACVDGMKRKRTVLFFLLFSHCGRKGDDSILIFLFLKKNRPFFLCLNTEKSWKSGINGLENVAELCFSETHICDIIGIIGTNMIIETDGADNAAAGRKLGCIQNKEELQWIYTH